MNKNLLIIIAIVAFVIGAYFILRNKSQEQEEISKTDEIVNIEIEKDEDEQIDEQDDWKLFEDSIHKVSLEYPSFWRYADLGGEKNVEKPLIRENIGYFYMTDENNQGFVVAVKLLRFVLEENANIQSREDWHKYIKTKVDKFLSNKELSADYTLLELKISEDIDDKFVIEEIYTEGNYNGRDMYIYNNNEFFQFVTLVREEYAPTHNENIDKLINSFKINK